MINRFTRFLCLSPSRRWQRLGFMKAFLITRFFYGIRLHALGKGSIIHSPLFWTPEFISLGEKVIVMRDCRIEGVIDSGSGLKNEPLITLGDNVIMQQGCHITAAGNLHIGSGTLISFNVSIQDTDHAYEDIGRSITEQPLIFRPTYIGENCFIGARASIQAGSRLGRHCVVGANAVVRGIFPDYCVLVGAPARIVKRYDAISGIWRRTASDGSFLPTPLELENGAAGPFLTQSPSASSRSSS